MGKQSVSRENFATVLTDYGLIFETYFYAVNCTYSHLFIHTK